MAILGSGVTTNPLREIVRLPRVPQNSSPIAGAAPRLHSRCDHVAVQPGYSNRASCVSGVSPLSLSANRPPALATAVGAVASRNQWTISSECCPRLVICPPE